MGRPSAWVQTGKVAVIVPIVVVMLYPFVYIVAMSLASERAASSGGFFPTEFSTAAYRAVLAGGVVTRAMLVSAGITAVGTVLSLVFTAMLAHGLTRTRDVPGSRAVLILVLCTMLFGAGMIPNYLLVKQLGLLDSYWSLILPGLISAFNMIVVRNFFMGLPQEMFEAARIDGAGEWRIFTRIVLPLSKAVLAVIALFYAVGYWNTFFNAVLYISSPAKWPIQVVLNQYVLRGQALVDSTNVPGEALPPPQTIQMAVIVIATVPILLVYPFAQRFFTQGVLTGAIKA
ncbi:ABC transporter permease [Actinomycetota bacterium]|nr:ABC transporter permease [Actinomycetota bacterium]